MKISEFWKNFIMVFSIILSIFIIVVSLFMGIVILIKMFGPIVISVILIFTGITMISLSIASDM